jgi:hypothetical protein
MIRIALLCACAGGVLRAQQTVPRADSTDHSDSRARAVASLVRFAPSAFPEIPRGVRQALERRGCVIPQNFASTHDTTAETRNAELADRANVVHGQFFERGKTEWAVICSAHGTTSIMFIPDDTTRRSTISPKMAQLSASPDSTWVERNYDGGWVVDPAIFLTKASTINRTRDGAKLDSAERARPIHDGLQVADMLDGSGYTIYWTGRRWIQVSSYD